MKGREDRSMGLEESEIVQVDVLDRSYIVVSFSNGVSARLRSEDVRRLAISSAVEIADAGVDVE